MPLHPGQLRLSLSRRSYYSRAVWTMDFVLLLLMPILSAAIGHAQLPTKVSSEHDSCCKVPAHLGRVMLNQSEWPVLDLNNAGVSKAPPMGFSFWNGFGDDPGPSDALTRQIADALVETGLKDAGYVYLLAFDGAWWSAGVQPPREPDGQPRIDGERWPEGIQSVSDYIHSRGLKVGGYTDIGTLGYCFPQEIGVLGHEQQDADQFARWKWDYIKIDDHGPGNFFSITKAIVNNSSHRPMVISLSTPVTFPYEFAPRISNLWRVGTDITVHLGTAEWKNVLREFDQAGSFWWAQAPGRWNDLDMLVIGHFGLSDEEAKSHFSMWAVRGAPLLIGADIRAPYGGRGSGPIPRLSPSDFEILKNREVIAVDQDSLGASGKVVSRSVDGMAEVDAKALGNFESGEYAVLLLNRGKEPEDITVTWRSLGLQSAAATVRDLWKHADLGSIETGYTATKVAPHGVVMLRVKGAVDWSLPREYEAESSYNSFGGLTHVRAQPPAKDNEPSSGEAEVVDIGGGPENTLQFNELWSDRAGLYNLTIRYTCPDTRQARIRTDGRSPVTVNFPATTEAKYSTVELKIPLQSGRNSVSLDNPTALAPTIDKIIISAVDPR